MSTSNRTVANAIPMSLVEQRRHAAKRNPNYEFEFTRNGVWATTVEFSGDDNSFFSILGTDFFRGSMVFSDSVGERSLAGDHIASFGEYWSMARKLSAEWNQARQELAPLLGKGIELTPAELAQKKNLESKIQSLEQELGPLFSWLDEKLIENKKKLQPFAEQLHADINWVKLGLLWNADLLAVKQELLVCDIEVDRVGDKLRELQGRELLPAEVEKRSLVAAQKREYVAKQAELQKKEAALKIKIVRHVLEKNLGLTAGQAAYFARLMQQNLYGYHKRLMGENKPRFKANGDLYNIDYSITFSREGEKIIAKLRTNTEPELYSEFEILISELGLTDENGKLKNASIRLAYTEVVDKQQLSDSYIETQINTSKDEDRYLGDVVAYTLTLKRESLKDAKELIRDAIEKYRNGQRFSEEEFKKVSLHREFRNNYGDKAYKACLKRIKHACAVIDGHALMMEDLRFIGNTKVRSELHETFIKNHGAAAHNAYLERLKAIGVIHRLKILSGNDRAINEAEIKGIIERFTWDLDEAVLLHTFKTSSTKRDALFQKYPGVKQVITECIISQEEEKDPQELCEDLGDSFFTHCRIISSPLYEQQKKNIEAIYPNVGSLGEFESVAEGLFNKSVRAIASVFTGINEAERIQRLKQLSTDLTEIQKALEVKEQIRPLKVKLSALDKKCATLNKEKEEIENLHAKNRTNEFITSVGLILRSVLSFVLPFASLAEKVETNHGNNKTASRVDVIDRELRAIAVETESITTQIQEQEKSNEYAGKSIESLKNLLRDKQEEYDAIATIGQKAVPVCDNDIIQKDKLSALGTVPPVVPLEPVVQPLGQKDIVASLCAEGLFAHAYEEAKAKAEGKVEVVTAEQQVSQGWGQGMASSIGGVSIKIK